jgi:hypothetical protein
VALADKVHNIRSINSDFAKLGNRVWKRFNQGRESQEWYFSQLVLSFEHGPESLKGLPLLEEFKGEVRTLFPTEEEKERGRG